MIILQATVQPRLFFRFDRDFSAFGRASRLRIGASARLWFTSSFTSSSRSNWPFTTSGPRMPRRRLSRSLSDTCCAGLALKPALRLLLIHTVRSNLEVMLLFFFLPRLFFVFFRGGPNKTSGRRKQIPVVLADHLQGWSRGGTAGTLPGLGNPAGSTNPEHCRYDVSIWTNSVYTDQGKSFLLIISYPI